MLMSPALRVGPWQWGPVARLAIGDGWRLDVGVLALLPALVTLLWLATRTLLPTRPWQWGPASLTVPLLALTLLGLPSLGEGDRVRALVQVVEWLLFWWLYFYMLNERPDLFLPLAGVLVAQGGVAVAQFLRQSEVGLSALGEVDLTPLSSGISVLWARGHPWLRAYGLTGHPNVLGATLAALLLLLLPAKAAPRPRPLLFPLMLAFGFAGLLVSFSRGAWLAFALGFLVWWRGARAARQPWAFSPRPWLVGALLGALVLLPYADLALSRWLTLDTLTEARSLAERERDGQLALRVIAAHPGGVGVGGYAASARALQPEAQTVHNVALLATAELGWLGLLGWLLLTAAGLGWPRRDPPHAPWVGMTVLGLFDIVLWPTTGVRGALLVALMTAHLAAHLANKGEMG